jgi:hypothetical protein
MDWVNSLPWFLWVVWGVVGIFYIPRWVIKSTKNDPILLRVGGMLMVVPCAMVIIDNLIRGNVIHLQYWSIMMDRTAMPLVALTLSLLFIGGYQKAKRPDFDPARRRIVVLSMYALVIIIVFEGVLFGGIYI